MLIQWPRLGEESLYGEHFAFWTHSKHKVSAILWKDSPVSKAAGGVVEAAALDSLCVCLWWGGPSAVTWGRSWVYTEAVWASAELHCPSLQLEHLPLASISSVSCWCPRSAVPDQTQWGRTAAEDRSWNCSPGGSGCHCTRCVRWWGLCSSSRREWKSSACGCCLARGTCPRLCRPERLLPGLLKCSPSTSL